MSNAGIAVGQEDKELRAMQYHKKIFQVCLFLFRSDVDLKKMKI